MKFKKTRWSAVYESSEEELVKLLEVQGFIATRNYIEPFDVKGPYSAPGDVLLWCVEGSAIATIDNVELSVQPGDLLTIHPNTEYSITAGISGFAYYI